jgi:hypothetical protein
MAAALLIKSVVIWAAILVLAMLNGTLREFVLVPLFGKTAGLVTSGLLLAGLVFAVAYGSIPLLGSHPPGTFVAIGVGWLLLTLAFEFSFGLLRGKPLAEILSAYAFRDGNLWSLVLVVTALAPWMAARLRGFLAPPL